MMFLSLSQIDFPLPAFRTVTQEDPGDNQVTLEEITQTVREETEDVATHSND